MLVVVEDAGPGVADDEKEQIFERFTRGSESRHRVGTGLGLALVAEHAGALGGAAWVEDRPGGGARFVVPSAGGAQDHRPTRTTSEATTRADRPPWSLTGLPACRIGGSDQVEEVDADLLGGLNEPTPSTIDPDGERPVDELDARVDDDRRHGDDQPLLHRGLAIALRRGRGTSGHVTARPHRAARGRPDR